MIADVTVAVRPGRLSRSGGYQMILHPALLEEKKGADHDIKSSDAGKVQFKLIRREPAFFMAHEGDIHYIGGADVAARHLWKRNRKMR